MTEIEKLKFQTNIENIKQHVRNALSGCWIDCVEGNENCPHLKQEESRELLLEWVNEDS